MSRNNPNKNYSVNLKKFDMNKITDDKVVVLIGKRNTGKSFLVRDILYHNRNIPIGTVISPTEMANHFYSEMLPKKFIHNEYSPEITSNIIKRQKKLVKQITKDKTRYGKSMIDPRLFLIMDDCLYDQSWSKDENIRCMFMNGRHFKLFYILTMQTPLGIPPSLRSNIDYIFILRENITSNRKKIHEHYAGIFPSYDLFSQVLEQCTNNYECLVIDNTSKSNNINDVVFWYKAAPRPNFKIGSQLFWDQQQRDCESSEDEGGNGIEKMQRHKISVNVVKNY